MSADPTTPTPHIRASTPDPDAVAGGVALVRDGAHPHDVAAKLVSELPHRVEPSDAECAAWPDATREYVEALEVSFDLLTRALGAEREKHGRLKPVAGEWNDALHKIARLVGVRLGHSVTESVSGVERIIRERDEAHAALAAARPREGEREAVEHWRWLTDRAAQVGAPEHIVRAVNDAVRGVPDSKRAAAALRPTPATPEG